MFRIEWLERFSRKPRPERYASVAAFLIAAGVCSVLICVAAYAFFFRHHPMGDSGDWGAFGAFISGAAGTALSAFTLAALAFTLGLQADELSESRALAHTQSKILEKQSATMAQQAFDSVFFNLLERFSQVRDSVKIDGHVNQPIGEGSFVEVVIPITGPAALSRMMADDVFSLAGTDLYLTNRRSYLQAIFMVMYNRYESELGPYFRTLYHIFKFVHNGALTPQQKINYANIARAQLSDIELCVLFYDALTDLGRKFKPLIEQYGILKHVNERKLLHPSDRTNESLYESGAFLSQEDRESLAVTQL
jgi:hypothetical protein